ncbi:MAG: alkyl hydroperoxide reductase subunit F [Nevskiales bacterium]|nr:alkyl hydroperoxide reductase subunit F [Nevskiales bacterium]
MLDDNLRAQLKQYLERLSRSVEITAYTDDGDRSKEMLTFLGELKSASNKISVTQGSDASKRIPSFGLGTSDADIHLEFAGIPLGHEFSSLVLALLQVGGVAPKLTEDTIEQIRSIDGTHKFETFFSLSCQNCPDVVQALNLLAVLNPNIEHVAIDGAFFQDEVESREVMSVPSVFLNGEHFASGRMGIEEIIAKLDSGASEREAEKLKAKDPFDMLIVGGGPAGAAAAIYSARKGIRTGVVSERFGGQVLDTMAIENFISVPETEGPKMATAMEQHVMEYDVDVMKLQTAAKLVQGDEYLEVHLDSGAALKAKSLVLATGARWRQMGVPGEEEYRNKGVAYCPHCDGPLYKGKRVAVIGGGNSGVEAAIDLAGIVEHVTLLEFDKAMRADAVLQRKLLSLPNVKVLTSAQTTEVLGDGNKVQGLQYKDRNTGDVHDIELEGIFVQIGLLPNSEWLKGTLELSDRGEIVVDDRARTSMPGVFAAGDVTTTPYKQIIIAMGQGSTAALSAFDHLMRSSAPDAQQEAA